MAVPRFVRHDTRGKERIGSEDIEALQDNLDAVLGGLVGSPLAESRLLEDVSISAGATVDVLHGLGRKPKGFQVVHRDAPGSVYSAAPMDATHLHLSSSQDVTCTLMVF